MDFFAFFSILHINFLLYLNNGWIIIMYVLHFQTSFHLTGWDSRIYFDRDFFANDYGNICFKNGENFENKRNSKYKINKLRRICTDCTPVLQSIHYSVDQ